MNRHKLKVLILSLMLRNCNLEKFSEVNGHGISLLEQSVIEGDNPVLGYVSDPMNAFEESGCLGLQP